CTHIVSSYLLLITHARAITEFFSSTRSRSTRSTSLVVFDSKLDQLKLPVLRVPTRTAFDAQQECDNMPRSEPVAPFARKYFDTVATFQGR
ncbi:hypothetical protein ID866_1234, partial [Astraeus odoratus]